MEVFAIVTDDGQVVTEVVKVEGGGYFIDGSLYDDQFVAAEIPMDAFDTIVRFIEGED